MLMALALMVGMVYQHHHHKADGSVCLCLNATHHHQGDDQHGCAGHDDESDGRCDQTLSEWLTKADQRWDMSQPQLDLWPAAIAAEPLYRLPVTKVRIAPERRHVLPACPIRAVGPTRAPPEA
ncbi:MAG: hypothetical protein ACI4AM_06140 [Muribaculaceae bacterium]